MAFLSGLLAAAAVAAVRPEGDSPEPKRVAPPPAPMIVVEGPASPRWTIAPDPRLARRYAPAAERERRGIAIRF